MVMADATHNLAIKCGFYHEILELHYMEPVLHLTNGVL